MFLLNESLLFIGFLGLYFFRHKKFRKTFYSLLLVIFGFFLFISCPIYIDQGDDINNNNQIEEIYNRPKESGYWLMDHIEIDEFVSGKTWEEINQTYEWCSGKGTFEDPYVIQNVSINAINYNKGISIHNSKGPYFKITNCLIYNSDIGIELYTTDYGRIFNNTIFNNNQTGILLHNCKTNILINNIIKNNSEYGIVINGPNSNNNQIYKNRFYENGKHALDNSKPTFNDWYYSLTGNFWDNYTGKDINDDNIGDIPYTNIFGGAGAVDNYPFWWDPPFISIDYPLNYTTYSKYAADFKVIIDEGKGDTFWYELASKNSSYFSLSGQIDEEIISTFEQSLWDNLSNGFNDIRFYVNDSKGYIGFKDVMINIIVPSISNWWNVSYTYRAPIKLINRHREELPNGYSVNVSINTAKLISEGKLRSDGNDLRVVWYNGSSDTWIELNRVNETKFNTIDTRIWFKTQNSILPNVYDADYYIYYGSKDFSIPPTNRSKIYDFFDDFTQFNGPAKGWTVINGTWNVTNNEYIENKFVVDGRSLLDSYIIENASIEVRVKSFGGNFGAGVMFRHIDNYNFYTAGIGFWEYEVAIGKWTNDNPAILDNTPNNEIVLINNRWYDLKIEALGSQFLVFLDGILKNSITDTDHLSASQIGFMTWTTSATSYFDDLKIRKLVHNEPILIIGNEQTFRPSFNNLTESADPLELGDIEIISVNITDISGINRTFIELEALSYPMIYIGADRWQYDNWRPLSTGNYTYIISAENLNGNWNTITGSIEVIDTTPPSYLDLIESSDPLELGNIEIITINITDISGINQVLIEIEETNSSMTYIGGDLWQFDSWVPNTIGLKPYIIYIKDNENNWNSIIDSILVVDTKKPYIKVNMPLEGQFFGSTPPIFNVRIIDNSLDKMWYILNINPTKYFFENNNSIDQEAWDNLIDGEVTITFYANDSAGNIDNTDPLLIYKDIITPVLIINSPDANTYWNTPPPINLTVLDPNFDTLWYRVGAADIPLTNNTEQLLDISIWDSLPDESTFIIDFYANDSSGNLNTLYSLTLYKDILVPKVSINSPINKSYYNTAPDIQVTISDTYFNSVWYEIGGIKVFLINGSLEPLDSSLWQSIPNNSPFIMNFFANDSAGNINDTYSFVLYKDITFPIVMVNSPYDNTYWNTPPPINLTVYDPYFDTLWYRVGTIEIELVNNTEQFLDAGIWNSLPTESSFIIHFYANDSAGNINSLYSVTLYKDVATPIVMINSPSDNSYWRTVPIINVTVFDRYLDSFWYRVGTIDIPLVNNTEQLLDFSIWSSLPSETQLTISFYANDSAGNINELYSLTLYKDVLAPILIINSPSDNTYWNTLPPINLTVFDPYFNSLWYRVGTTNIPLANNTAELFDILIWNSLPDETQFTIYFYANDFAGNINNLYSLNNQCDCFRSIFRFSLV